MKKRINCNIGRKKIRTMAVLMVVILGLVVLSGCISSSKPCITGTALYLEKIALPPQAVFEVTLQDVSRADVQANVLGSVTMASFGQVPISFSVPYDESEIIAGNRYSLRAKITVDGELKFVTDKIYPALTGTDDGSLQLIMKMVRKEAKAPDFSSTDVGPFTGFPKHFLGLHSGAGKINQLQLDLFSNNVFFQRVVGFNNGTAETPEDNLGRWAYDKQMNRLVLKGFDNVLHYYAVIDPNTIELLGKKGEKRKLKQSLKLENSHTAQTIEPHVFLYGMYQYMADAATFRECLTGVQLPVSFEGDHASLERAYLGLEKEAGKAVKVHLEGSLVQRPVIDGKGTQAHLLVNHFIKLIPSEVCDTPNSQASLTNTYWRLIALNGATVGRETPMLREAHLVFHNEHEGKMRVAGSTGCNSLTGTYKLKGSSLVLAQNPLAMTMMACPPGNIETEFVGMLEEVTHWEISGEHLVLFGDQGRDSIARFEATYLR